MKTEVENSVDLEHLAQFLQLIANPERLRIMFCLLEGSCCVCDLTNELNRRQPYVSQHLMVLRQAGLVKASRHGWNQFYAISSPEIKKYLKCIFTNWQKKGDSISPVESLLK